jgi:hypothetical protein
MAMRELCRHSGRRNVRRRLEFVVAVGAVALNRSMADMFVSNINNFLRLNIYL